MKILNIKKHMDEYFVTQYPVLWANNTSSFILYWFRLAILNFGVALLSPIAMNNTFIEIFCWLSTIVAFSVFINEFLSLYSYDRMIIFHKSILLNLSNGLCIILFFALIILPPIVHSKRTLAAIDKQEIAYIEKHISFLKIDSLRYMELKNDSIAQNAIYFSNYEDTGCRYYWGVLEGNEREALINNIRNTSFDSIKKIKNRIQYLARKNKVDIYSNSRMIIRYAHPYALLCTSISWIKTNYYYNFEFVLLNQYIIFFLLTTLIFFIAEKIQPALSLLFALIPHFFYFMQHVDESSSIIESYTMPFFIILYIFISYRFLHGKKHKKIINHFKYELIVFTAIYLPLGLSELLPFAKSTLHVYNTGFDIYFIISAFAITLAIRYWLFRYLYKRSINPS